MGLSEHRVEAAVAVSDLARARDWYEGKLGLDPADVEDEGVRYRCAGGTGIFIYVSQANAGSSTATVAGWSVADLDAAMAELGGAGVEFEHYDQPGLATDQRGVFQGPGFRAAWFRDPDGNTFAVTQQGA